MPPLSQPKSTSRSLLTVLAVIVFVTAMVLVILQNMGPKGGSGKIIRGYDDGYADGFRAAREQSGLPIQTKSSVLSGKVTSIGANTISFIVTGLLLDERADGISSARTANITNETTIVLIENRPSADVQAEQRVFDRAIANFEPGDTPPVPPALFAETNIALTDIHEGDIVTAEAATDQNILPLESFTAVKISVRRAPVVPTAVIPENTPPTTPPSPPENPAPAPTL